MVDTDKERFIRNSFYLCKCLEKVEVSIHVIVHLYGQ